MINFSNFEENVSKLDAIRGGKNVVDEEYSSTGTDATTGQTVTEVCIVSEDGSFINEYYC